MLSAIKKLGDQFVCIEYALKQTNYNADENKQLEAFHYLVDKLISMQLPQRQAALDEILQNYAISYLSSEPDFTRYLLSAGALPINPNKSGIFPIPSAIWAVNDIGNCKTANFLIKATPPEALKIQNQKGETPLMQVIDKGNPCPDELKLLLQKSISINRVDNKGNTALHYFLIAIGKSINEQDGLKDSLGNTRTASNLMGAQILLEKKASTIIANKEGITAFQIMKELKLKGIVLYE